MSTLSAYHRASDFSALVAGLNEELDAIALSAGAIINAATGGFFANGTPPARIHQLSDRVFVGAACLNDGNPWSAKPGAGGNQDYISQNIPQGPTVALAQFASLSTIGGGGGIFGTRTSDTVSVGTEDGIAVTGIAINDATGPKQQVGFGGYFEAQQKPGAGFTAGIEVDAVNQSGIVSAVNPYNSFNGEPTVNILLGAGGARSGVSNVSAAMMLLNNGALFDKGIVFQEGSIESNEAIALASGHVVQWWGADGVPTSFVQSTAKTTPSGIVFNDLGIFFGNNSASVAGFGVPFVNGAVNYVEAIGALTGGFAQLCAAGQDASIGLALLPKGNGQLILGGVNQTPTGSPVTGIEVMNARDGQIYVIPLYAKV